MNATDDQLEGNVRLTVYVPLSMKRDVQALADKRRQKLSGLMIQVIEKFLTEESTLPAPTAPPPAVLYGRRATDRDPPEPAEVTAS